MTRGKFPCAIGPRARLCGLYRVTQGFCPSTGVWLQEGLLCKLAVYCLVGSQEEQGVL